MNPVTQPGWVNWLRPLVPPAAVSALQRLRGGAIRFTGDYPTWEAAKATSNGYDDTAILERVRESAAKVRDGKAAFERDGVAFDRPELNFPLLACLLRVASECGNRLRVLDFGGSLGSSYFQCREFLVGLSELLWTVVEQPHFVECGRREFETEQLRFREDTPTGDTHDVVLLSSVLPYLPEPFTVLEQLTATGAGWLVVDRTPVIPGDRDVLTVQRVPAGVYGRAVSYPAWLFFEASLGQQLAAYWKPIAAAPTVDPPLPGPYGMIDFRLWLCRRRTESG